MLNPNIFSFEFYVDAFLKIRVQLLYNVLVSAVYQSESVTCIHISVLFGISFPFRSAQNIEQSSLCYTVGSHQLSILYIVYIYINANLPVFPIPLFSLCFANNKFIYTIFLDSHMQALIYNILVFSLEFLLKQNLTTFKGTKVFEMLLNVYMHITEDVMSILAPSTSRLLGWFSNSQSLDNRRAC